ncbi:MAG: PD-(D/E)XK nuclease family protein [Planctomycetota bacterium]
MNVSSLANALKDLCRDRLLEEKWLLAPSLRVGHQWMDIVTRAGQPAVNVRIKTIRSMALELAAPHMTGKAVRLVSGRAAHILVDRIFRRLRGKGLKYLGALPPTAGLTEVVYRSVQAIRLAGLKPDQLPLDRFEVDAKGHDLRRILAEYLKELERLALVDYATVLGMANKRVQDDSGELLEQTTVVLPEDLHVLAMEQQLLDALPEDRKLLLPVDGPVGSDAKPEAAESDIAVLRWLPRPADAPSPPDDGTVEFFRAVGEVNEVREVLRRLLGRGIPLDEAELLCTDADTYVPLIYETMTAWAADDAQLDDELPVTFADGIPSRFFRPGRLLGAWVTWVNEDFPQARLVRMIREGLLTVPDFDEKRFSFTRLATVLRGLAIGFGKDRYLPKLEAEIAALERRFNEPPRTEDDDDETAEEQKRSIARRLEELRLLHQMTKALLDVSPSGERHPGTLLSSAITLLEKLARVVNKSDSFARQRLVEEVTDLHNWLADEEVPGLEVWDWLAALPDEARVLGSGPRPGRLHVAGVGSGGHSGRPVTYIVGLDDGRFPGTGSQDPLLLDAERRRISRGLPTAASDLEEKIDAFYRLLARLRGKVVLSFSGHDLVDNREKFPSPLLLAAYRILSGNREGTQEDFLKWLGPPASFAPSENERCLSVSDWWLRQLCSDPPVREAERLVMRSFPHLASGREATGQRSSSAFTPYDGRVEQAGLDLDPCASHGPVMSSRRFEMIGCCPLAFFFHRGLEIQPPEELVLDATRWLDPLIYGSLLHEVFEQFVRELVHQRRLPQYPDDLERLEAILDERIAQYRDCYPPPNDHAYLAQVAELRGVARTFLAEEDRFCAETGSRPVYLEASLGMPREGERSEIDTDEPLPLHLPKRGTVRVRGRVDRIDLIGGGAANSYAIWDYKSGSAWPYSPTDPFRQGRVVQPALYLAMVAHRLGEVIPAKTQVAQFGFFFPSAKERGLRIQWDPNQLADGERVLGKLVDIVRNGAFLATDEDNDCKYCDYAVICGDTKAVAAASEKKLSDPRNKTLQPFRELRGYGQG